MAAEDKPYIFLGSEDPLVIEEALQWGEEKGWTVLYTDLVNRSALSARLPRDESEFFFPERGVHDKMEYFSMILNLEYSIRWVEEREEGNTVDGRVGGGRYCGWERGRREILWVVEREEGNLVNGERRVRS